MNESSQKKPRASPEGAVNNGSDGPRVASCDTGANKDKKKDDQQSDLVRSHAVKHLTSLLSPIFESHLQQASTPSHSSPASPSKSGRKFAETLEQGIFEAYAEAAPGRATLRTAQRLYKDRFRTLSFSLRDKSNEALRARIFTGELSPEALATLPSEKLANDAIRARTEKAREQALRQSVLKQQEVGPLRKMTHKGEVDIEHENAAPLLDSFNSRPSRLHSPTGVSGAGAVEDSLTEDAGNPGGVSEQEAHMRKSFSDDCHGSSPSHDPVESPTKDLLPSGPTVRGPSAGHGSPQVSSFDFSNVWQADKTPLVERSSQEDDGEGKEGSPDDESSSHEADCRDKAYEPAKASDDFIDTFLSGFTTSEAPAETAEGRSDDITSLEGASTTPASTPPPDQAQIFWRGAITMPDEATISGHVRQVGGRRIQNLPHLVESFFPNEVSILEGRLPTKVASDYLLQSRVASRTELVVFAMEKSFEKDVLAKAPPPAPTSAAALDASFDQLLNYLQRRQRYGVLLPSRAARGRTVKDFYIAPLPKNCPIPQWLELLGSLPFLGQEEARDADMMLLVAVVFKSAFEPAGGSLEEQSGITRQSSGHSSVETSAAGLNSFLAGSGSDALQDLLKAVGGANGKVLKGSGDDQRLAGDSKPFNSGTIVHKAQQQQQQSDVAAVLGALNDASPTTDATSPAAALSHVPQQDITKVLTGNPDLLSQLLKTLGGAGEGGSGATSLHAAGAIFSPSGPPPGPPPRPPPSVALGVPHGPSSLGPPPQEPPGAGVPPSWGYTVPGPPGPSSSGPPRGFGLGPRRMPAYGGPPPYGATVTNAQPTQRFGGQGRVALSGPPRDNGWGARGGTSSRR